MKVFDQSDIFEFKRHIQLFSPKKGGHYHDKEIIIKQLQQHI